MREIKFRAWDEKRKRMFYLPDAKWVEISFAGHELTACNYCGPQTQDNLQELKLMQFTGLKDKRGKEIYEGDIVKGVTNDAEVTAEVEWDEGGFALNLNDTVFPGAWWPYLGELSVESCFEVIGNVCEKLDLLGERQ